MISMRTSRAGLALVLLFSASLSAAVAHLAIDVLGDFLLAHDAYDGMAHTSRSALAGLVLAGAAALAVRHVICALDPSDSGRRRSIAIARALLPQHRLSFAVWTAAFALVALCAMEVVDARAAGVAIDDPADLLGGSLILGSLTLLGCAIAVAAAVFGALRALLSFTLAVVSAVHSFFVGRTKGGAKPLAFRRLVRTYAMHPQLALRARKRGPPPSSSIAY